MVRDFYDRDAGGGFYQTSHSHEALIARSREGQDGALPNANAIAAQLCLRLSHHLDRADLRELAEQTVASFGQWITRAPRAFASMLLVIDLLHHAPVEVVVVGPADASATQALLAESARVFLPQRVLAHGPGADAAESENPLVFPLLRGKTMRAGEPAAYVCRNLACSAPISDPGELRRLLSLPSG